MTANDTIGSIDRRPILNARQPAAVLFDMDGTLVDSEKVWDIALGELAVRAGGTLSLVSPPGRGTVVVAVLPLIDG